VTPGQYVGPYLLESSLGKGGMGAVFLARAPQGAAVALKVLHDHDPERLARFQREAQVLRHLDSLRIVRLLDFGLHQGRPYLVQELCEGGDLAGALAKRGALPPEEARELVRELAAALEVAHQAGIVHRDLKPANVLLHQGQPKLTDFGLARAKGIDSASLTETGGLLGTPAYMAPEQLLDARAVDARADVYALGVILYELLAGAPPFRGRGVLEVADAVLCGRYPPLSSEVPAQLRQIVARAMAVEAGDRYASAEALALALIAEPPRAEEVRALPLALLALLAILAGVVVALFAYPAHEEVLPAPSPSQRPNLTPPVPSPPQLNPSPAQEAPTPDAEEEERAAVHSALDSCAEEDPAEIQRGVSRLKSLAEAGSRRAHLALGELYLIGHGVERNVESAQRHLGRARAAGLTEALLTLAHCERLERWGLEVPKAMAGLKERCAGGDLEAAWQWLGRVGVPCAGLGKAGELYRLQELVVEVHTRLPGTRGRQDAVSELLATPGPDSQVEQVALRLGLPLDPGLLPAESATPRACLLAARDAGARRAEYALGDLILKGRIEGTAEEGRRYLRRAALKGSPSAGLALWKRLPAGDPEGRRWLEYSARLGVFEAVDAHGVLLHREGRAEARPWLEFAANRGQPNACAALANLLQGPESTSSEALLVRSTANKGASHGRGDYLKTLAASLADPRGGPQDRTRALVILAGLAIQKEDGEAALAAAALALKPPQQAGIVRPLLRRALAQEETRGRAAKLLAGVTKGIATSAPVASQSQLTLERWAGVLSSSADAEVRARQVRARIEIGRRARAELQGHARAEAMRRAAETGDPRSQFAYAQMLYIGSKPGAPARQEALRYYRLAGDGGIPAAAFYYNVEKTSFARALNELERVANDGNPAALRFHGFQLLAQDPKSQRGRRQLERARALGDSEAEETLRREALRDPRRRPAVLQHYLANPLRYRLALGQLYAAGQHLKRDSKLATRYLLEAATAGETGDALLELGRHLLRRGETPVALLWLLAAAERGLQESALVAARVMLGAPHLDRFEEAVRILRSLVAANAPGGDAKLALGLAHLNGAGVKLDVRLGEQLLEEVRTGRDTRPEIRTRANYVLGANMLRRRDEAGAALLNSAFAAGDTEARVLLAHGHLYGILLPKNAARGWRLLREGAEQGDTQSQLALARALLERESRRPQDLTQAREWVAILEAKELVISAQERELDRVRALLEDL